MRLTFLGSGGGRWVVLRQLRSSGGFVLELAGQKMHVDPGPGALLKAKEYKVDLCSLTAVLVSHRHMDHHNDAIPAIESMTRGATKKKGAFLSTRRVIEGESGYPSILDQFHRKVIRKIGIMDPGKSVKLGRVRITSTPTVHRDDDGVGFLFEGEGMRIGYTGDSDYFKGMESHFRNCDLLVMNVLRPRTDSWPGHMNTNGARKLMTLANPRKAVIQHFGMKMLKGVAHKEARWLRKETRTEIVVARDGLVMKEGPAGKNPKTLEPFLD